MSVVWAFPISGLHKVLLAPGGSEHKRLNIANDSGLIYKVGHLLQMKGGRVWQLSEE